MLGKVGADQANTIRKASYTGKFKDEHTWTEWEVKLENYLYKIPGVNGVPMSYAVQSQAAPDRTTDFQGNFVAETIACVPLSGTQFKDNTSKFHQRIL